MIRSLLRYLRDYFTLLAMAHSRIDHVRECTREMIRRDGWRVKPLARWRMHGARFLPEYVTEYQRWRDCWQIMWHGSYAQEIWLHYNRPDRSSHVIRWRDGYGIIRGDGSKQGADLEAFVEKNR